MEARTLRTVSQFLVNDNGRGDGGNGRVRSVSKTRTSGGNGPETFYFDVVSDKYVTSNDNVESSERIFRMLRTIRLRLKSAELFLR